MSDPAAVPSQTSTTSTSTSTPWSGAAQYLDNGNSTFDPTTGQYVNNGSGETGAYQQAINYANQYATLSPTQQALSQQQIATDNTQLGQLNAIQTANYNAGNNALNGAYNTNVGAVSPAQGGQAQAYTGNAAQSGAAYSSAALGNATTNNLQNNLSSMGGSNPTSALSSILQGNVSNNPYLAQMNQANIDQATQGYNQDILKLTQQTLPQINNDAFASGGYGGSRQGIAQGMALQGMETQAGNLAQNALGAGAQLYGGAFQNAQNLQSTTANNLLNTGVQNGQYNAGNDQNMTLANMSNVQQSGLSNAANQQQTNLNNSANQQAMSIANMGALQNNSQYNAGNQQQNNQYNASLGLQNNQQAMTQQSQNLNNAVTGSNMTTTAMDSLFNGQNSINSSLQGISQMPQQQQLAALNALLGAISPGASAGGVSTQQIPYFGATPLQQATGLAASGAGLIGSINGK